MKNENLTKTKINDVYIYDCGENGYKLVKSFLNANKDTVDRKLEELDAEGIVMVNTLTTAGTKGPNLICIDADKFSHMSEQEAKELQQRGINIIKGAEIIEHKKVEDQILDDKVEEIPAGDITIWDPNKTKAMGLMFSNSAPTIILKSDNGKVGMGVLVRQNITTQFFNNIKEVMGGNITIEVVSSTMGEYPAVKEDGTELLPDASNKRARYTLAEYIGDVASQVGIQCNYENCINIDKNNKTYGTDEKGENGLKNTAFIFDPSELMKNEEPEI